MTKEILLVNGVSFGAITACLAELEMGLALLVLITALYINIRNILRDNKRK